MKVVTVELIDSGSGTQHQLSDLPNLLAEEVTVEENNGYKCSGGISVIQRQRTSGLQTILMQPMTCYNEVQKKKSKKTR